MVVGGGHNGLVAAAYLARSGLDALVCERRDVVGGAAVSEHPFGPDYTVTSLSYVVSLLPAGLVARPAAGPARLPRVPAGPLLRPAGRRPLPAAARRPGGRGSRDRASSPPRTPTPTRGYEAYAGRDRADPRPAADEIPPRLGSRRPADLWRQGLLLRHLRKLDDATAVDVTRLLTGSIADLSSSTSSSDAMRGLLSVSGVIGTWAGPRSAGTGYVMLHHHIGDVDGQAGRGGSRAAGWAGSPRALAAAARSFGAEIRTGAEVARIRTTPAAGSPA